jgi:hypothetical protein
MKSVLQWSFFLCIAAFFFFSGWYVLFKLKPIDLSFVVMGVMLLNATFMSSATIAVATFFCAMLNVANDQLSKVNTGLGKQQMTDAVFWAIVAILTFSVMQLVAKNDAVYPEVSRSVILLP